MVPDNELSLLLDAADAAVEAADAGRFCEGHTVLIAGLERARRLSRAGRPWGEELTGRYAFALERYSAAYSVLRQWQPPVEEAVER